MPYTVEFSDRARRKLKSLSRDAQELLEAEISKLPSDPRPAGAIKMQGIDCYRIRRGDYRIVYAIYDDKLVILVLNLGDRGSIYDRKEMNAIATEMKRRLRDRRV